MRILYFLLFWLALLPTLAQAQVLSAGLQILPRGPGEEFCPQRIQVTTSYPVVSYEWFFLKSTNGHQGQWLPPFPGATTATIVAPGSGTYQVKVTDANGVTALSGMVGTYYDAQYRPFISAAKTVLCASQTIEIRSNDLTNTRRYQWYRDGSPILNATDRTYRTDVPGTYTFRLFDAAGCFSPEADPVTLTKAETPGGQLVGSPELCLPTSNTLTVNAVGTSPFRYEWLLDNQVIPQVVGSQHEAKVAGTYQVLITDGNGCTGQTDKLTVRASQPVTVQLAPVPAQCLADGRVVTLTGTPAGGAFAGSGVANGQFDPRQAGAGTHVLTYRPSGGLGCVTGVASQTVLVSAEPVFDLGTDLFIREGGSVTLPGPVGTTYQYAWTPAGTLSDPVVANPIASPKQSTTYQVAVRDQQGCEATDTIRVFVQAPLLIPSAFSPNGDGVNDIWQLTHTADVPNLNVTVFNRWGEVVFNSVGYRKPFDGLQLQAGLYTYLVQYGVPAVRTTGTLLLLR